MSVKVDLAHAEALKTNPAYPIVDKYLTTADEEFDKRMHQEYAWYVRNEEHELEIYKKNEEET